jgi:hypothetical protein
MLTQVKLSRQRQARNQASTRRRKARRAALAIQERATTAARNTAGAWLADLDAQQKARAYVPPPVHARPQGMIGRVLAYITRTDRGG